MEHISEAKSILPPGTVYRGVMLPPSMLRANGSCRYLQRALQKPAVKAQASADWTINAHYLWFPLVHYCRFTLFGGPKKQTKQNKQTHAVQGANRLTTEVQRGGGKQGERDKHTQARLENRKIFHTDFTAPRSNPELLVLIGKIPHRGTRFDEMTVTSALVFPV